MSATMLQVLTDLRSRLELVEAKVKHLEAGPPTADAKTYEVHYDAAMNPKVHSEPAGVATADAEPESTALPPADHVRGHSAFPPADLKGTLVDA